MITEDYVSFEVAKLLKEKGFDVFGDGSYGTETEIHREYSPFGKIRDCSTSKPSQKGYPAPTLQMAMKWLREVHNISIEPLVDFGSGDEYWWTADVGYIKKDGLIDELCGYNSYEEAAEAAIKYCLENLIYIENKI